MAARYATNAEIVAIAPELADVADATITTWATIAAASIGVARFGELASTAHALLAAHLLTTAPAGLDAPAGVVASEAVGPANRSFAVTAPSDPDLGTSAYGRAFVAIRTRVRGRGSAVVGRTGFRQV
jgi:hypothetical protein